MELLFSYFCGTKNGIVKKLILSLILFNIFIIITTNDDNLLLVKL